MDSARCPDDVGCERAIQLPVRRGLASRAAQFAGNSSVPFNFGHCSFSLESVKLHRTKPGEK